MTRMGEDFGTRAADKTGLVNLAVLPAWLPSRAGGGNSSFHPKRAVLSPSSLQRFRPSGH